MDYAGVPATFTCHETLITSLAMLSELPRIERILEQACDVQHVSRHVVSYSVAIGACEKAAQWRQALTLLAAMVLAALHLQPQCSYRCPSPGC